MAILPLSCPIPARDPFLMALVLFLVLLAVLAVASAAGWVTDSRTFDDWPSMQDGERLPMPRP
jgi:hypothetical protein